MPHPRPSASIPAAATLLLLCLGCAPQAAVQLVLTPDPDLNSAADVASQVSRLLIVADADGGLPGVEQAGTTPGGGEAEDWDGDGALEVAFEAVSDGDETLPVLEVGVERSADRALTFRVLGFGDGDPLEVAAAIALGGSEVRCAAGELCRVGTPFNLLAAARAPKVVLVLPADQALQVPVNLHAVTLVFSTTLQQESVAGRATLEGLDAQAPEVALRLEDALFTSEGGIEERRSILQLLPQESLPDSRYRVRVSPGVLSSRGRRFDQLPQTEEEDAFESEFLAAREGGGTYGPCPDGYIEQPGDLCAPEPSCGAGCADGYVCEGTVCVADCRPFAACPLLSEVCDVETGLCRPG